jgi:hypothetical protein
MLMISLADLICIISQLLVMPSSLLTDSGMLLIDRYARQRTKASVVVVVVQAVS